MKSRLLGWLCCPSCGATLGLRVFPEVPEEDASPEADVDDGLLTCSCGNAYPIVSGVPRMIEGSLLVHRDFRERWAAEITAAVADSSAVLRAPSPEFLSLIQPTMERFDREWSEHPLEERTWGMEQATRLRHTLNYLGWTEEDAKDKVILDAGCGTGKLTCGMATWGAEAVGLDLAPAVVRGWQQRSALAGARAGHVHIVQGDVMRPPFRAASFDAVHCSGVLHHTPDTARAFRAVAGLVKPGGSLGVWLYREGGQRTRVPWLPFVRAHWASIPESVLRPWTTRLDPRILYWLLYGYSLAFHAVYSQAAWLRGRKHGQSVRERATSLFDSLAPPFDWRHHPEEVRNWFREAGFEHVRETTLVGDPIGVALTGVRGGDVSSRPKSNQGSR